MQNNKRNFFHKTSTAPLRVVSFETCSCLRRVPAREVRKRHSTSSSLLKGSLSMNCFQLQFSNRASSSIFRTCKVHSCEGKTKKMQERRETTLKIILDILFLCRIIFPSCTFIHVHIYLLISMNNWFPLLSYWILYTHGRNTRMLVLTSGPNNSHFVGFLW